MPKKIPPAPRKQILRKTSNENPKPGDRDMAVFREIREMQMDIENLKGSILSQTNIQALESDFYREFQRLSTEVKENLEKNRHAVDRMEAEVKFLKEDVARVISIEEEMKRISAKSLERDVESLKARSQWLETHMKGFDIDPLIEKIQEMDDKIKIMKASQPLIIE
jgi:cell division protein FtsB